MAKGKLWKAMYTSEISKFKQLRRPELEEQEINYWWMLYSLGSKLLFLVKLIPKTAIILIFTPGYCHQI